MSLPVQPSPRKRRRDGTDNGPARKKRIALLAVAATVALILVAVAALLFLPTRQNPSAAPSSAPAVSTPAPTPDKPLPPAPAVTYYKQAGPPAGSPLQGVEPLKLAVSGDQVGTSLPTGLTGISLEATDLGDEDLSSSNPSMVKLLSELDQPVLRFGGNAVDRRFFWTSSNESIPAGYSGDAAHPVRAVGPADLTRLNTLLQATGARVSLTVDLAHYDPARAADMMKHATAILGDRLLSFTVGNEPNGFVFNGVRKDGYSLEKYLTELKAYAKAIYAVAPNLPISGPGAYDQKWWQPFVDVDIPQKKILSFHHYPQYSCDGSDPIASPTLANLMDRKIHDRAADYHRAAVDVGKKAGLETWLPETGIAACPGSNETSKTHASALWTVDYALNAAQLGITQVGFHSSMLACKGGPPMSAICSAGSYPQGNGAMSGRANFFGMSMLGGLGEGKFLKVNSTGGGLAYSYAVQHADGSTSVVIVNENNPETAAQTDVTIDLPGRPLTGTMSQLTGPSYGAQDATQIDGAASEPVPLADRPTVPGFVYGERTQKIKLTAGTATVLNFTY
ncbi:hypothetical protein [Pseudarthrobacter sp. IC2-21]|uniref:hypothetical protein n=1 Tax=Pseudarthrobacter sp. IC2-21 TaxID=3092262 RepID=UPI002A6B8F7C|nr:hypothetical protein [Pseudarthrobacter sp. IC2-21]